MRGPVRDCIRCTDRQDIQHELWRTLAPGELAPIWNYLPAGSPDRWEHGGFAGKENGADVIPVPGHLRGRPLRRVVIRERDAATEPSAVDPEGTEPISAMMSR
jgi:hypothetical protein